MIGNDIVDLSIYQASPRSKNQRYIQKVLTDKELALRPHWLDSEVFLWTLWSAKESVYKIVGRNKQLVFKPKQFECIAVQFNNQSNLILSVRYNEHIFTAQSEINKYYVHTSAAIDSNIVNQLYSSIIRTDKTVPQQQSSDIRQELLKYLKLNGWQHLDLKDFSTNPFGAPFLKNHNLPFSISHHGNWSAFTILK